MATLSSIARPYAQAAYEFARQEKAIPAWELFLKTATQMVKEPALAVRLANTRISSEAWYQLLCDLLGPQLNDKRKNFLKLLTDNKRVYALPEIADLFKDYEIQDNQMAEVEVVTALPMEKKQEEKLAAKLAKLFKHPVSLRSKVDENILGGVIVRAGDKVIDGSVRGQLSRLLEFAIR